MNPMFAEGLNLMLTGMGMVFAFLVLLVWVIKLMSFLVARYAPEPERPAVSAATAVAMAPVAAPASLDATTLTVIADAVRQHRAAGH